MFRFRPIRGTLLACALTATTAAAHAQAPPSAAASPSSRPQTIGAPLVRDTDGLALSSRNKYLDARTRAQGLTLHQALLAIQAALSKGQTSVEALRRVGREVLDVDREDYLEIVDPDSLQPLEQVLGPARVLVAAFVGTTRLIDNMALIPG